MEMQKIIYSAYGTTTATHTIPGSLTGWYLSISNSGEENLTLSLNGNSIVIPYGYIFNTVEQAIKTFTITGNSEYSVVVYA